MDSVALLLYIGGNIIIEHNTVQYSTSATKATRVSRSISFRELKEKVYSLLNIDSSKFTLKLSSKYSFNDKSRYVEAHLQIDDDNNLQFMLDISNEMQCLELFIETEPIERHVAVDDPESYIPRITQGLNALGFNSVGYNEDASTSAFAWHGATDQNRYTSDHDIGDWDQYVRPTLEENVSWPFSSARQWSFVDDPLDISRNAHIGSSVGAIPRDIDLDRSNPHVDHEDHGLHELSSDIHRDDTDISTEPDLSVSDTDEDDGGDANDRFEDIGPSHVNRSDRMHSPHHAAPPVHECLDTDVKYRRIYPP
ncbi:serine/threonine-protein phosphatase 7 long form [Dorcoceras hygrometricum]|uniref:Serine/threonine-protein phosphatase 7 long form n=1 Tax=Dorcoceras hygrometricum TaxID=472368 RepID=A0A2Z7AYI7_9LAMI|nr:serine/threonine-protein phosphatase 7 long form [Dorcoceras hygrometricum]